MKELKFIKIFEICIGIFALGSVLFPKQVPFFFLALISVVVFGFVKKQVKFHFNVVSFLFILFYLTYLFGVFFTHNGDQAQKYVENKLSFVILPLLLSLKFKDTLKLNRAYLGFVIGTFLVSIYGVFSGLYCYFQPDGSNLCLFTSSISPIHHPTYLSAYLIFSIGVVLKGWYDKMKYFSFYWIIPFIIFNVVLHGFLLSLSGILFLLIAFILAIIIWIKYKFGKWVLYSSIILIPILGFLSIKMIPQIEGEWGGAVGYSEIYFANPEHFVESRVYPMSGTEVRIVMWTAASKTFYTHPFGVGTGNVDEYLGKELIRLKQKELSHENYNPHNQFLQTGVEIGVLGLLILLAILFFAFRIGYLNVDWLLIIITGNLLFNALFESMLQRQSGIVFYTFWFCLLVLDNMKKNEDSENKQSH